MKPAPFEYCRAETIDDALALLAEFGSDASLLSGGMSLGAMLNMRLARPGAVIDLNHISGLDEIVTEDRWVETGARVRQGDALKNTVLNDSAPLLMAALPHVGHFQTRSRGTLGGSAAHADPSAEIPLCLVTLDGEIVLRSSKGKRTVAARDFFQGVLTTDRRADEMITALIWPSRRAGAGYAFDEIAQRRGDFAIVAAACVAELDESGKVGSLAFGLGGVEDRPIAIDVSVFTGEAANGETARALAEQAASSVDPVEDMQANKDYRRQLVRVLGAQVIESAFERAGRAG
ncbi:MAG: carbon monoxide dehydrogenase [Rhodospirillaceae bacterium]|jgi:2-furoyl-CoA dehydrogenase FAD binding subunit|nr:carbon monoxide dehydrogenase [Rhodospirillaceae bacterium]